MPDPEPTPTPEPEPRPTPGPGVVIQFTDPDYLVRYVRDELRRRDAYRGMGPWMSFLSKWFIKLLPTIISILIEVFVFTPRPGANLPLNPSPDYDPSNPKP